MPGTKSLNASRHVDLIDLEDATDVVARATGNNDREILHKARASTLLSKGEVRAGTDVFDQYGNVRNTIALSIKFDNKVLKIPATNIQDALNALGLEIHKIGRTVHVGNLPPPNPIQGDLWFDTNSADLLLYYDDQSGAPSAQWLVMSTGGADGRRGPPGPDVVTFGDATYLKKAGDTMAAGAQLDMNGGSITNLVNDDTKNTSFDGGRY